VGIPERTFVTGEKFWVSSVEVRKSDAILRVYSDPYDGVRYYGEIIFPMDKKALPSGDDLVKMVAEVITVQPAEAAAPAPASVPPPPPVETPAAYTAPIPPPPPPVDAAPVQPKTVSVGQTKAQVLAILGQPGKIAKVGAKEIDYYTDMKVIFVGGKVTDIE
jgi:hypothetical protein